MQNTFKRITKKKPIETTENGLSTSTYTALTGPRHASTSNDLSVFDGSKQHVHQAKADPIDPNVSVEDRFCTKILDWKLNSDSTDDIPQSLLPEYETYEQYVMHWEPCLVEEVKATLLSAVSSRYNFTRGDVILENFTSVESTAKVRLLKYTTDFSPSSTGPIDIRNKTDSIRLMTNDLVLLTYTQLTSINADTIKSLPPSTYVLAFVASAKRYEFQIKVLNGAWKQLNIFANEHTKTQHRNSSTPSLPDNTTSSLIPKSRMQYIVLDSVTSSFREYNALLSLNRSLFLSNIISLRNPSKQVQSSSIQPITPPSSPSSVDQSSISGIGTVLYPILEAKYNTSQLEAIRMSAHKSEGLTLVQGPPGTGKTTTILGIINTLHVKYFNRSYASAISATMSDEGMLCRHGRRDDFTSWINLSLQMKRPRLLVLAPSNIAVDNIIERVLESGFIDGNGNQYWPSMLRLGSGSKRSKVKVISLEDSSEHIMGISKEEALEMRERVSATIAQIVQDIYNTQTLLLCLKEAWSRWPLPMDFELRVDGKNASVYWVDHKRKSVSSSPPDLLSHGKVLSNYTLETLPEYLIYSGHLAPLLDQLRHQSLQLRRLVLRDQLIDRYSTCKTLIESSLIDDAHIVFTTLNSSGHSSLDSCAFDDILIDEAAQCIEPSLLIPLRLSSNRCLLVGDPMQLPATIFSTIKSRGIGFDRSLFERLMGNGHEFTMLRTQYRMLPQISAFPNTMFYGGKLLNGDNVLNPSNCPPYINLACTQIKENDELSFLPFIFFDLKNSRDELKNTSSRSNHIEAMFIIKLLNLFIRSCAKKGCMPSSIGIITPYQEQLSELKKMIGGTNWAKVLSEYPELYMRVPEIELNTVDSFQGREKDVIFISCVRANDEGTIGFLSDVRRMNVALTRSKYGLFVVGHADTLRSNSMWTKLITHAEETSALLEVQSHDHDIQSGLRKLGSAIFSSVIHPPLESSSNASSSLSYSTSSDQDVLVVPKSRLLGRGKRKADEGVETTPCTSGGSCDEKRTKSASQEAIKFSV